MRITLFAVGRLKAGPEKDLASRYLDRFAKAGPAIGLELAKLVEVQESRASNADTRKREEAGALEKALPEGAILVLLDERGKTLDSQASWLSRSRVLLGKNKSLPTYSYMPVIICLYHTTGS
jgi:23S rRNA (pseudouridine1915-N3)-methyltransferase